MLIVVSQLLTSKFTTKIRVNSRTVQSMSLPVHSLKEKFKLLFPFALHFPSSLYLGLNVLYCSFKWNKSTEPFSATL